MLAGLARWCVRHRWVVIGAWVFLLVAANGVAQGVGADYRTSFTLPDSETQQVQDLLIESNPNQGFSAQIVTKSESGFDDPEVVQSMERLYALTVAAGTPAAMESGDSGCTGLDPGADASDSVITLTSPFSAPGQISPDGTIAFASLDVREIKFTELNELGARIQDCADEQTAVAGVTTEFGGDLFGEFELPESEVYGLIAAVIILILAFGSVLAMGLPIGTALIGLGIAFAGVSLSSHVFEIPDFTSSMVAMIGLGVGIDYALFIVTRYREQLHAGHTVEDSVVRAMDTSGRAVMFAGITVVISLLGLVLIGLAFVTGLSVASVIAVIMMMLASITLLPALLGAVGTRIDNTTRAALIAVALFIIGAFAAVTSGKWIIVAVAAGLAVILMLVSLGVPALRKLVPHRAERPADQKFWYRWSRFIQRRPWPALVVGAAVLIVLALPMFGIRLGFGDQGNLPETQSPRRAFDLLADGFGPGSNGPLIVLVQGDTAKDADAFYAFVDTLNGTGGVEAAIAAPPEEFAADAPYQVVRVVPETAPQDEGTSQLVNRLRNDVIPAADADALVGGLTAASVDFSSYLAGRMVYLFAAVLGLSFLLLMAVFRSLLVPLKAVIMNLLSIGAAYGILVAIFQWGWGLGLLGLDREGPIEAWVPMFLFAIVFGLSMDYEVFLLSRIKEEYDKTKNNARAVADGLAATARVITAAAAIMCFVFAAFALGDDRHLKLFGLGLAIAVFLDASIVRMVLVPATMELLDDRNWWLPKWLSRLLPRINVEGHLDEPPVSEASGEAAPAAPGSRDDSIRA